MPKKRKQHINPAAILKFAIFIVIVTLAVFTADYLISPPTEPVFPPNSTADTGVPGATAVPVPPNTENTPNSDNSGTIPGNATTEEVTTVAVVTTVREFTHADYDKEFFADTLFIGDSIFTGLSGYKFIPAANVFAKEGLAPSAALTIQINDTGVLEKAKGFKRAVIMLGTNSLANNADALAADMKTLVSKLKESSPGIETVVLTVTPVAKTTSYSVTIDMVNSYNNALAEAAKDSGFRLIDICADFKDGDGYIKVEYVQPDGLHLHQEGYKEMLSLVQYSLEQG